MAATYKKTNLDAVITVVKSENPRRAGTAAHKRAAAVLRANGRTIRDAVKAGAKPSTVRHMVEARLVRVAAPKKVAA